MMNHWMFRCKDVSEKISLSLDVTLPLYQRMAIRFHLMMCRYCARFRRQLVMLRKICRQDDSDPTAEYASAGFSREAKNRLKAKLHSAS